MILYTDGVTEAFNAGFNAFGEERLAVVAKKSGACRQQRSATG